MVFSSHVFLFGFLPIALALYYLVPLKFRNLALTSMSYIFYGWATPYFIVLIMWSTAVDYVCGNFIFGHWRLWKSEDRVGALLQRKMFLAISLLSNIGMLGFLGTSLLRSETSMGSCKRRGERRFPC